MRRYTTATPSLIVEGVDISDHTVWVTFQQLYPDDVDSTVQNTLSRSSFDAVTLTVDPSTKVKSGNDTIVTCSLTQEQTAQFKPGRIRAQVNWKTSGGIRKATDIVYIPSFDNLLEEVK
jgi:hypothetical protein